MTRTYLEARQAGLIHHSNRASLDFDVTPPKAWKRLQSDEWEDVQRRAKPNDEI